MAVRTYLGALRGGALDTIQAAAQAGADRAGLVAVVREQFPALHWTRAQQVVARWERGVTAAVNAYSRYQSRVEPGLFTPHRYVVKLGAENPDTGEMEWFVLKIDSDRPLSLAELRDRALQRTGILASIESPGAQAVKQVDQSELEVEITIHLSQQ